MTSNKRILDRAMTPELMGVALRISQSTKSDEDVRPLLEIALRDHVESKTGRVKTGSILAGSWLKPAQDADALVVWARDHLTGDVRVWHLGVLLANYSFFGDLCAAIGKRVALGGGLVTSELRAEMKAAWGDRDVVNVATRSAIRTLRAFSVLEGDDGAPESTIGPRIEVERTVYPWLIDALLACRGQMEIDSHEASRAPEFFMFDLPASVPNGYEHLEHFTEGGGRVVIRRRSPKEGRRPPSSHQLDLSL